MSLEQTHPGTVLSQIASKPESYLGGAAKIHRDGGNATVGPRMGSNPIADCQVVLSHPHQGTGPS